MNVPVGRAWWARDSATFRATVRLAVATRRLLPDVEPMPEVFEQIAAVDVYFLDAVSGTHCVDVPDHAPQRTCPKCQGSFLPVASRT